MQFELKDLISIGVYVFTFGGLLATGKYKFLGHERRIKTVEECLTTPDHEPRFMSYKEHEKKCRPIREDQERMFTLIQETHDMVTRLDERSKSHRHADTNKKT